MGWGVASMEGYSSLRSPESADEEKRMEEGNGEDKNSPTATPPTSASGSWLLPSSPVSSAEEIGGRRLSPLDLSSYPSSQQESIRFSRQLTPTHVPVRASRFAIFYEQRRLPILPFNRNYQELSLQRRMTMQLVPNIIIEHVMSRDAHRQCLTPPLAASPCPTFPTSREATKQIRAHSDSSVHEMETHPELHIPRIEIQRPRLWSFRSSSSPQYDIPDAKIADVKDSRRFSVPFHRQSTLTVEKSSPKSFWLRRHSDSNLSAEHGIGHRVEPYPIRSHSTGDTVPINLSLPLTSETLDAEVSSASAKIGEVRSEELSKCAEEPVGRGEIGLRHRDELVEKRLKKKKVPTATLR